MRHYAHIHTVNLISQPTHDSPPPHTHTHIHTVLRPFFQEIRTTRVSQCLKRTSGLYGARED